MIRYPGFDAINSEGKMSSGPFVVPGEYSVSLSKLVDGVETDYGQQQSFEVVTINNRTFASKDRDADLVFDMKVGRLAMAIQGAGRYLKELDSR